MNEQITLSPELEARVHQAVDNFMQGYGCCQSVWLPLPIYMVLMMRWRSALVPASVVE